MPHYRFEAITYAGKTERGSIEGESIKAAKQMLMAKQLVPVHLAPYHQGTQLAFWQRWSSSHRSISSAELAVLSKQLALLVRSGVPIDEVIAILANETNQVHIKNVLQSVLEELRSGLPLSRAIACQPLSFDSMYQGVVAAAEQSGKLGQVLTQLADFLEKKQALRQKALGAIAYPAMLSGVSIMVIIFLMTYVVPQIANVFQSTKQTLPLLTQVILATSQFIVNWGWLIVVSILIASLALRRILHNAEFRLRIDRFLLNIPWLGPLILSYESARFAHTMAMLIAANVPILQALTSSKSTLVNRVLQSAVDATEIRLREGVSLSRALASQGVFSPILIYLVRSGEASGQVAEMLRYAAENAELESEQKTKLFTNLLEPLLILLMGGLVLIIVLSVMQPILDMNTAIR
jgi:general secretion pathway protein F